MSQHNPQWPETHPQIAAYLKGAEGHGPAEFACGCILKWQNSRWWFGRVCRDFVRYCDNQDWVENHLVAQIESPSTEPEQ